MGSAGVWSLILKECMGRKMISSAGFSIMRLDADTPQGELLRSPIQASRYHEVGESNRPVPFKVSRISESVYSVGRVETLGSF
jgi:hypothetical protein